MITDLQNYIVPILIVLGWLVTICVAKKTHKKNDRIHLINKKNDVLRDLSSQATRYWSAGKLHSDLEIDDIIDKIDQVMALYKELERDHGEPRPSALEMLRRTITLDIDDKGKLEGETLNDRKRKIRQVIEELNSHPVKFK